MIGFALCGSFCTVRSALEQLKLIVDSGYSVQPIVSETVYKTDTRFQSAAYTLSVLRDLCGREPIHTVTQAEPLGPEIALEALVICPCTGNTLAKLAGGITDTAVTMAAKAHLRCDRPLLIALASNDAMSANLRNIATLLMRKNVFFVPMRQDDPVNKPHSLVADFTLLPQALQNAFAGKQMRKIFI